MKLILSVILTWTFQGTLAAQNYCQRDESAIRNVVSRFQTYQKDKNARGVLSLFTAPVGDKQRGTYTFLLGLDAAAPRLYGNVVTAFRLESFEIKSLMPAEYAGQGYCVAFLEEKRTYGPGPANPGGKPETVTYTPALILVRVGSDWKVDKYAAIDHASPKYSAWGY